MAAPIKSVFTGRGYISTLPLLAVWSVSLVVRLPGLAITPLLESLEIYFPTASALEVQLLTLLPNLIIVPFILFTGRFATSPHKVMWLVIGLCIYLLAGILYLFASAHITHYLLVSCLLGLGAGLVIPLAVTLLAEIFSGKERLQQMGIHSGIANLSLIMAIVMTGWLADTRWQLSFVVYLIPIVPLLFCWFLRRKYVKDVMHNLDYHDTLSPDGQDTHILYYQFDDSIQHDELSPSRRLHAKRHLVGILLLYFVLTICAMSISYYLPMRMNFFHLNDLHIGWATALFFIGITLAGFSLPRIVNMIKSHTIPISLLLMLIGFTILSHAYRFPDFLFGTYLVGMGFGVLQPLMFDKMALLAWSKPGNNLRYMVLLQATFFLAIGLAPFIEMGFAWVWHIQNVMSVSHYVFPFMLSAIILGILTIVCTLRPHDFIFET